ncbi:hypothetical protein ACWCXH_35320 [Kitasatospora sp. NPDC001660]
MRQLIDPDTVPLTPLVTIVLSSTGVAMIDGNPMPPPLPGQQVRTAALIEVSVRAARLGRPVRVLAREADGTDWPLIVDVDGSVTAVPAHPVSAAPALQPAAVAEPDLFPTVRSRILEDVPAESAGPVVPAGPVSAAPALQPASVAEPDLFPTVRSRILEDVPAESAGPVVTAGPVAAATALSWTDPLPEDYADLLQQTRDRESAGDLRGAVAAAEDLEAAVEDAYGPDHPYTVNTSQLHAYFAMSAEQWELAARLYAAVARRCHELQAPLKETRRAAVNAFQMWLRVEEPVTALEIGPDVVAILQALRSPDLRHAEVRLRELSRRAA